MPTIAQQGAYAVFDNPYRFLGGFVNLSNATTNFPSLSCCLFQNQLYSPFASPAFILGDLIRYSALVRFMVGYKCCPKSADQG